MTPVTPLNLPDLNDWSLLNICIHLDPKDLSKMEKTSKQFRDLLRSPQGAVCWQTFLSRTFGITEIPPHLSAKESAKCFQYINQWTGTDGSEHVDTALVSAYFSPVILKPNHIYPFAERIIRDPRTANGSFIAYSYASRCIPCAWIKTREGEAVEIYDLRWLNEAQIALIRDIRIHPDQWRHLTPADSFDPVYTFFDQTIAKRVMYHQVEMNL